MSVIKNLRETIGYTQADLAAKSGLSLRTVQRLEARAEAPKGYSLRRLAEAFGLEPAELRARFSPRPSAERQDKTTVRLMNLAILAFFFFPFGNIWLPLWIWRNHRAAKLVDVMGRKMLNFQILWSLILIFSLSVSPFISGSPLILYVLFFCLLLNLGVMVFTARAIHRNEMNFPVTPIKLL